MEYDKNEREYLNNFSSNESAEKFWNSIREKEFQEAIAYDSNEDSEASLKSSMHYNLNSDQSELNYIKCNINPTNDQSNVLKTLTYCVEKNYNEQFLIFIHGGPGVGKTWTMNEFKKTLMKNNKKFICTAYTGVAASLLTGGETIHSLFQFHIGEKNPEK